MSAVPVIVKIFADLGILHRNLSQLSLSVAVIDDATVWIGLSIIAAVIHLRHSSDLSAMSGDLVFALTAVIALALIAVVGRRSVRVIDGPGVRNETGVGASCLVAAAFITLGAVLTDGIGLDSTLGAFVCGTIVASGWLVPVTRLRPLRTIVLGVLAPLFLATSALSADLTALRDPGLALAALAAVVLAIVSKSLGAYGGGRLAGLGHQASMVVSSALNARGRFSSWSQQRVCASVSLPSRDSPSSCSWRLSPRPWLVRSFVGTCVTFHRRPTRSAENVWSNEPRKLRKDHTSGGGRNINEFPKHTKRRGCFVILS